MGSLGLSIAIILYAVPTALALLYYPAFGVTAISSLPGLEMSLRLATVKHYP
ncbi:MAG: hypothetical protein RIF36_09470 [Imperialibacter sp.]|uniref:hypothetical protein n=1 Tax=Imperialibacter sp. TaxID=2038411 RepID=UPI0032EBB5C9